MTGIPLTALMLTALLVLAEIAVIIRVILRPHREPASRVAWVVVREFAFQVRSDRKANDRVDFSETLYWHAGVRTNARDGKAEVEFGCRTA